MSSDGARRAEILETAAALFASCGLRVSLQEIADACGILPGSLYHHFDSKEAIVLELVRRYRHDLDEVTAEAVQTQAGSAGAPVEERIVEFGRAIAACGVRHRAALLLTLYEPPTVLGGELADLARDAPTAMAGAMLALLGEARASGVLRPQVDVSLLSDRLCQSMLHVGVGVSHVTPGAEHVPELRLHILLHGIAPQPPPDETLDASSPMKAVEKLVAGWDEDVDGDDERTTHLQAVARKEFGRRGFEATTMRDVAAAAGLSTGTVYRSFSSKDELLLSIMRTYSDQARSAWRAALESEGSPLEKLDALMCANIHLLDRFSDEFRIQLAWLRQSPPTNPDLGRWFAWHLRHIKGLLADGAKTRELHLDGASVDIRARCVYEATVVPPGIVSAGGTRRAQSLARDTVLRGALVRSD
jgi:AcrR family transcriptional regulator